jgi:transposase
LIRAANARLRAVIVDAAHRLARFDPHWKQMKERLKENGKNEVPELAHVSATAVAAHDLGQQASIPIYLLATCLLACLLV